MTALSELDILIGGVLITGFEGLEVGADFEDHYLKCPSGGFILFGRNAGSAAQVRALTDCLRDVALAHNPDHPTPLIGIDQEGGSLSPLRGIVSSLPGNMGLAATGDPEAARYAGYVTGCDLTTLGISLNFAPVLDLAREPLNPAVSTRSFGDDPGDLDKHAWFKANSAKTTHPVRQKPPNAWGLHDMHGNVAEWCLDFYAESYGDGGPCKDPRGPEHGEERVLRGGSWNAGEEACRCAARRAETPGLADVCFGYEAYGFRCVRRAEPRP